LGMWVQVPLEHCTGVLFTLGAGSYIFSQ
jgi:hypothetical protein